MCMAGDQWPGVSLARAGQRAAVCRLEGVLHGVHEQDREGQGAEAEPEPEVSHDGPPASGDDRSTDGIPGKFSSSGALSVAVYLPWCPSPFSM